LLNTYSNPNNEKILISLKVFIRKKQVIFMFIVLEEHVIK